MANGFLMAAIIAAIALTFWRPFRRVQSALGLGHLVSTGHVFIAVGCLLGLLFE
jgi:hypothetical protein